jgi:predicted transcriptional regulator/DNA-binding XRE family transcriptional regulator
MLESGEKPMVGHKVRQLRTELGLTQSDMAATIGISASYLNLIEHNQRPVTVSLLFKLGQAFDIDLKNFAADDSIRLITDMTEMFADNTIAGHTVSKRELRDFVVSQPNIASTLLQFYNSFLDLKANVHSALAEGEEHRSLQSASMVEDIRVYLQQHGNYFAELEDAAENFINTAGLRRDTLYSDLCTWFRVESNLDVQIVPAEIMGYSLRRYDPHRGRVLLSEALRRPQRIFQLLLQAAFSTQDDLINKIIKTSDKPAMASLLRNTLAGYFAAAVMMPYSSFAESARTLRYDIDLLGRRFGVSFEQVCHRLTTLNRQGDRGISFFFIRIDPAGNISKRLSAGKMQFANHGGTCARWIVHHAFKVPSKIITQIAETEEGQYVFTMARTVSPLWMPPGQPEPEFAVALGCDVAQARDIAHADHLDLGRSASPSRTKPLRAVPIGISCRVCERMDCAQRSQPPLGHNIRLDPYTRKLGLFDLDA